MSRQIHASCAAKGGAAVLLLGPSGSGKSDLLLRLIDRGFVLVADDRVEIEDGMARPTPGLEGLVEMRGLGILRLAYRAPARLALAVRLDIAGAMERLPEPARHETGVPLLQLDPRPASAPLFVAHGLACALRETAMQAGAFA